MAYTEILTGSGAPVTYRASLAASYQVAFDQLAIDEPTALDLLILAAHLAPEPIPFTLFTAHPDLLLEPLATTAGDPLAFADLTRALRRRALARISTDGMQLHRLVQAILLNRQASDAAGDGTAAITLRLLRQAVPGDPWNNLATWPAWRQLLPHVLSVTNRCPESADEEVAWLLDRTATYLLSRGEPRSARPLLERAFELCQQLLGEDHPHTLTSANNLANNLYMLGELEAARQLNENTLIRYRRILGEDHSTTLTTASNLADDLRAVGEPEAARQLNKDTLSRRRRMLGEDHPDTLHSAKDLAADLRAVGEPEAARQLHEDTLARRRRVLGDDHPHTLDSANNLADVLQALAEHQRAHHKG